MSPPTPTRTASVPTPAEAAAPVAAAPPARVPVTPPYRLELGGGYTSLDLGVGGEVYSGGHFSTRIGQNFHVHPQHSFFLGGVFRLANLTNATGRQLNMVHYGLEGGYEATLAPGIMSAFVSAGLGTNMFFSDNFDGGRPGLSIDNQASFALTLGGGLTFLRGILVLSGGWQPNFGLQARDPLSEVNPPMGYNPQAWFFNVGLNLAALADWAGATLPRSEGLGDWGSRIKPGLVLDTTYTYNVQQPHGGRNALRLFDNRWDRPMLNAIDLSLELPSTEEHPFGMRADAVIGEDSVGAAPRHSLRSDWFYLQQFYASLRLPIHRGITVRAGQFATPIGAEVLEGPLNNQVSRSFLFNYGIPFTHTGLLVDIPITEQDTISVGTVRSWDNVAGSDGGFTGLGTYTRTWSDRVTTMLSVTLGEESGRFRSLVHGLVTWKPQGPDGASTLQAECGWGHENAGNGMPSADWPMCSLLGRYNFNRYVGISGRAEAFFDIDGVRTGTPQTLGEETLTLHVEPFPWMRYRLEGRFDQSSEQVFLAESRPTSGQFTLGLGAALVF